MNEWIALPELPPMNYCDFCWCWTREPLVELAFWNGTMFQDAESAGDREGLSIKAIEDVTHWKWLDVPSPPTS